MYRVFLFLVSLFLLSATFVYAQPAVSPNVDKLYHQLTKSGVDSARVKLLLAVSRYDAAAYSNKPALLDSTLAMALRVNQFSARLSFAEGMGLSYQLSAHIWCKRKDFKKSDKLIKKAISVFLSHRLYTYAAEAYLNMEEFYLAAGGQDYKVMIGCYEQALPLFEKSGAKLRAAATLNVLGDFNLQINNNTRSIACLNRALDYYHSAGFAGVQNTYNLLGNNYFYMDKLQDALKYQLLAVKTAETAGDTSMSLCSIYNHTGMVYYTTAQYKLAVEYFKKAITIAKKYHDQAVFDLSCNLANTFNTLSLPVEAIAALKRSEKILPPLKLEQQVCYDIIYLGAYDRLKKFGEAGVYCNRLSKFYDVANITYNMKARALKAMLQYAISTQKFDNAATLLQFYKKAVEKGPLKVRVSQGVYFFAYRIDSARKNYFSAMQNYRSYSVLKDSILRSTINKQMQELQVKYETEKKEKQLISLKKDGLLQRDKVKQADHLRNITLLATLTLLVLIILLYHSYRVNKKNSHAISLKNQALNQLVIEKEWLVKEIHHRVKNNLQIVMGLLQRQSAYIDNHDALAAIQNSENRMHSIALIHQKLYQSENLDLIFMPEYINEMIGYLKDSCGIDNRIFFEIQIDDIYLDVAQAVPLGLILNEAITNAIKYAYPPNVPGIIHISLIKEMNNCIELTIADNGPGLPAGFNVNKVESLGINLIRGLSKQLGGGFEIVNRKGCMINVSFNAEIFSRGTAETEIALT